MVGDDSDTPSDNPNLPSCSSKKARVDKEVQASHPPYEIPPSSAQFCEHLTDPINYLDNLLERAGMVYSLCHCAEFSTRGEIPKTYEDCLRQWQLEHCSSWRMDNTLNELVSSVWGKHFKVPEDVVSLNELRYTTPPPPLEEESGGVVAAGISMAIQSHGLQRSSSTSVDEPSTSSDSQEDDDEECDDFLEAAVASAISARGLCNKNI